MKINYKSKKFILVSIISAIVVAAATTFSIIFAKKHRKYN